VTRSELGTSGSHFESLFVEADLVLVDEFEQKRGDIGDRDGAVAEVHGRGGWHARHRLADCQGGPLATVVGDPHDGRLECDCFTTSLTMRITASALADSVGVAGDSDCRAADAQLVSRTSAHSRVVARKMTGIPRILAEGGLAAR